MKKILAAVLAVGTAVAAGDAPQGAWTEDFEAAKARAVKEGKDLLIDFTGSDWCGWCVKLKKEVFDTEDFLAEAPKHFVLVELDFPRKSEQDPKVKEQNQKLMQEFGVKGFPSIFLASADGTPYAKTGYQPGGPKPYLESLAALKAGKGEAETLLAKAEKAQGVERARFLDAYLAAQEKSGIAGKGRKKIVKEIVSLDAENAAGLKGKYEIRQKLESAQAALQKQDVEGALSALDEVIGSASAEASAKQQAHFFKGMVLAQAKKDVPGALAALEEARKADPQSQYVERIAAAIQHLKQQQGGAH